MEAELFKIYNTYIVELQGLLPVTKVVPIKDVLHFVCLPTHMLIGKERLTVSALVLEMMSAKTSE